MEHCHENHVHRNFLENLKYVARVCNYCFYDIIVLCSEMEENNYFATFKSQQVHFPPVFANHHLIWQWKKSTPLNI